MEEKKLYEAELCLEEKGRRAVLSYYLTRVQDCRKTSLYGLKTELCWEDGVRETAEAGMLTCSRQLALSLLERLHRGKITPLCLEEVVDDFLAEC